MKKILSAAILIFCLLAGSVIPAMAADTATLSIIPDKTEVTADGQNIQITYTITVTPPEGKEIGVFSFRLEPSGDMTLPQSMKVDGEKVVTVNTGTLRYNSGTGEGVFKTFEYTPESNFFAAVGSLEGNRMTAEAQIMTIVATIPAGSSGAYALNAEFTVAPDGSGVSYAGKVVSPTVTITDPDATSSGSGTVIVSDLDDPTPGDKPDTDVTVDTGSGDNVDTETTWYVDGEPMGEDDTIESGHVYTVVTHVTTDGTFDESVYTNAGYTVKRISDKELEVTRRYYVAEGYTQVLTEEEAASVEGESSQAAEKEAAEKETAGARSPAKRVWVPVCIGAGVVVLAVVLLLLRKRNTGRRGM